MLDPELLSIERFAPSVTSTVLVGVRLKGDDRTMADRLAEMNYYPRDTSPAESSDSSSEGGNKERLLRAAAELFAEYSVEATSVAQLAKRAEVSTTTFFNLYGSKSQLAIALFDRHAELHAGARRGSFDPRDPVMDHLIGVADLAACHTELAKIFLAELVVDDSGIVGTTLVDPLADLVAPNSRMGHSSDTGDARDLAQIMVTVAMQRALRRPSLRPGSRRQVSEADPATGVVRLTIRQTRCTGWCALRSLIVQCKSDRSLSPIW